MNTAIGLWIDHRKAVIVIVSDEGEEVKEITSHMEKHVRFSSGNNSEDGSSEDIRDRSLGTASTATTMKSLRLFGTPTLFKSWPGEAKGELESALRAKALRADRGRRNRGQDDGSPELPAKVRGNSRA